MEWSYTGILAPGVGQRVKKKSRAKLLFSFFRLVFHVLGIATSLAVLGYFIYLAVVLNTAVVAVVIAVIAISTSELIKHVLF